MSLLELFCEMDDFYQGFAAWAGPQQLMSGRKRGPKCRLSESEVMTILIHFHESHYRDFKSYYQKYVCKQLRGEFPGLVSYSRFVELTSEVLLPLCAFLQTSFGEVTGISFVDSTHLAVCHNKRTERNKVFAGLARRDRTGKARPVGASSLYEYGLVLWVQAALGHQRQGRTARGLLDPWQHR